MIFITNESELQMGKGICALYFYADWLLSHKKMQIMITKVEEEKENIKFFAIDIESFKSYCLRFKIDSIPTILVLGDGGLELKRINGLTMTSAFKKVFADIYSLYEAEKTKNSGDSNGKK